MLISTTAALDAPLTAATLLRGDFADSIKRSAEMGYDGIEIQFKYVNRHDLDIEHIAEICDRYNVKVSAMPTGSLYVADGLSLISPDEAIVNEAQKRLTYYCDALSVLGGKLVIGCMRGNLDGKKAYDEYCKILAEQLKRLCEYADKKSVPITLEAINRYENNYLATASETIEFIEKYKLNMGLLLDTFHMNIEERNMEKAIADSAKYLNHVHFSDSNRMVPGSAHTDFNAVAAALKKINYNGWLSFECCVNADENAEAEFGVKYVRKLLCGL